MLLFRWMIRYYIMAFLKAYEIPMLLEKKKMRVGFLQGFCEM